MPIIETRTANPQRAITSASPVSPEASGQEAFQGLATFGRAMSAIDERLQAQKDEVDVVGKVGDYHIRLAQLHDEVLNDPELETPAQRTNAFKTKADEFRQQLNEGASRHVQRVLSIQATHALSQGIINLETADRAKQVQQLRADGAVIQGRLAEREAQHIANGQGEEAAKVRAERMELVARAKERGVLNPQEASLENERMQNQTWESVAQQNPEYLLTLQANVLRGKTPPAGMDAKKLHNYVNIAINTLNASQWQEQQEQKRQAAQQKATEDANAAELTADVLEGKPTENKIGERTRARTLDPGWAIRLRELQHKLASEPDLANYEKGAAAHAEAALESEKYTNRPLQPHWEQDLLNDYLQGKTTKEEFRHLMGVLRGVEAYKHQEGKEQGNQDVSHAHSNLVQRLRTTGPADKFDALSEQTIAEAGQFFYRKMGQNPNADPWKVMEEAEKIFKPAIEKRLGVSKADKAVLDEAKITAMEHTKVLSRAGAKALREQKQGELGANIVQETLKNLPPPPPPGYFERFFQKKPERQAGVMQGE